MRNLNLKRKNPYGGINTTKSRYNRYRQNRVRRKFNRSRNKR